MLYELISRLPTGWQAPFAQPVAQDYLAALDRELISESKRYRLYPPARWLFRAMAYFPPEATRVVILGQDPYIGPQQAMGLAFSVPEGISRPPSLRNILQEVTRDVGSTCITHGDLTPWATQGVLLLNTTLTVRAGQSLSHAHLGWERVTDAIIRLVALRAPGCAYMLWGRHAQRKAPLLAGREALVLEAPHPSPLSASRGFFGCAHFSQANTYLQSRGRGQIDW